MAFGHSIFWGIIRRNYPFRESINNMKIMKLTLLVIACSLVAGLSAEITEADWESESRAGFAQGALLQSDKEFGFFFFVRCGGVSRPEICPRVQFYTCMNQALIPFSPLVQAMARHLLLLPRLPPPAPPQQVSACLSVQSKAGRFCARFHVAVHLTGSPFKADSGALYFMGLNALNIQVSLHCPRPVAQLQRWRVASVL